MLYILLHIYYYISRMDYTYTKTQLLQMNSDLIYGFNWIMNLENINNTQTSKLYPTGDACMSSGRFYVALPATTVITKEHITKYNILI